MSVFGWTIICSQDEFKMFEHGMDPPFTPPCHVVTDFLFHLEIYLAVFLAHLFLLDPPVTYMHTSTSSYMSSIMAAIAIQGSTRHIHVRRLRATVGYHCPVVKFETACLK